jgi:hypothetical protein
MRAGAWLMFWVLLGGSGLIGCGPGQPDIHGYGVEVRDPGDDDPHMTGLVEPTPEEMAWREANAIRAEDIRPNRLAIERIQATFRARGILAPKPETISAAWQGHLRTNPLAPPLPVAVDNSQLPAFPPIRSQGSLGSCASFSATYYQHTHTVALARGWDAKNGGDQYRFSPKWTYNFVNDGTSGGSTQNAAFNVLERHGCVTWAEFPYNGALNPVNYRPWYLDSDGWRDALAHRIDQRGTIRYLDMVHGLQALKQALTNGYVLNYGCYINSWQFLPGGIKDDPATPDDDPYVGQQVCHWTSGSNGAHGMTVVGYNDAIWVDVNQNDIIDEGEKGALKIANSWGTGWRNGGFAWIAYDALRDVSRVEGAPTSNRNGAFNDAEWITVRENYQPTMTAEFTLDHLERNQMMVNLGTGETSDTAPTRNLYSSVYYAGGAFAFDGTTTAVPFTFVFDFTDIAEPEGVAKRYFLGVRDRTAGVEAGYIDFKIVDHLNSAEALSATPAQTVDDDVIYAWVDYTLSTSNTPPTIGPIPNQLVTMNGEAGPVAFVIGDAETPAADLMLRADSSDARLLPVSSIVFSGSGANRSVTLTPVEWSTGTALVTIWVDDGVASTGSSFRVNISRTGNTPPILSDIADQATQAGVSTAPIPITVNDSETDPNDLTINVNDSQGFLMGSEVTGSGTDRQLRVCPRLDVEGETEVRVFVSDGELSAQSNFILTVSAGPANTAPTISAIADQVTDSGVPTAAIPFTVGDAESDPAFLQFWTDTDNWELIPFLGVQIGGSGADRTITVCPAGGRHGTANITVWVWDGALDAQTQFQITVNDTGNTPPVISPIADQVVPLNGSTGPIPFTVSDAESPAEFIELGWQYDNWDLVSWSGVILAGSGSNRTLTVTPFPGESGTANFTIRAYDGTIEVTEEFVLTVDGDLHCGNDWLDEGEVCDPPASCPADCDDNNVCTADNMTGDPSTCDAVCSNVAIVVCGGGEGCCPAGCHANNDPDCEPACDNGEVETGETCDPPNTCPTTCDDLDACTADSQTGDPATCDVLCANDPIVDCGDLEGCCPAGCHANNDPDCEPACDNGEVETGETCDPPNTCPDSCDDGRVCTADSMPGAPATCDVLCSNATIVDCADGDGCCPAGCDSDSDNDCSPTCGNSELDPGETCDPPDTCPDSCDDQDACTADSMAGDPSTCNAVCSNLAIVDCSSGDGCCPAGCDNTLDTDCPVVCGNGVIETGERCDPPENCPSSCDDGNSCTVDSMTGGPATCDALCTNVAVVDCANGDGCCPAGCDSSSDDDCSASCGNSVLDPGETCDPQDSCPDSCDDQDACTTDTLTGSAANCNVDCSHSAVTECNAGDGCCPPGCRHGTDSDCPEDCGNGSLDQGETCDPPESCPTSCNDDDPCTEDSLSGSPGMCNVECQHTAIDDCASTTPGRIKGSCGCSGSGNRSTTSGILLCLALVWLGRRRKD